MKTKDLILTGALVGVAYLLYKNSMLQQNEQLTDETSGGGGGGGGFPLSYHPILPAISNPIIAPINVVVPPLKPRVNRLELNAPQVEAVIPTTTSGTITNPIATQQEETINP